MMTVCLEHLDERQHRIVAGSLARALGYGRIVAVAEATGMSSSTVQRAVGRSTSGWRSLVGCARREVDDRGSGMLSLV